MEESINPYANQPEGASNMSYEIHFEADEPIDEEDARKQRFANMTDKWPALAKLMNGKTWEEIYALKLDKK